MPNVPASMLNDSKTSAPGFELGRAHAATTLLFEEPDGELLNPAYLKEIVATALHDGHVAGLKEGRNVGFREGLEAGKRTGRVEGHEEGLREGIERGRLERSSSIDTIQPQLLQEIRLDTYDKGYAEGGKDARYDAKGEFETALAREHTRGYLEGPEEEHRSWVDKKIEAQSCLDDLKFWEGYSAAQQIANAQSTPNCINATSQTDPVIPFPSVSIHVDCTTQTISEPIVPPALVNIQPVIEPAISSSTAPLSWADDVASLPISMHPPLCSSPPRDFSVLRSESLKQPFGSLQHKARRSHRHGH
ncbi:hypothetical protein EWM64_g6853 [Hericium alpestre]|uniref:Essential protein Yae1 N-terminal domain-containing protein n=1 Tax=Hericium alpestre TaxID=135208 RepID=A0A4Y9ZUJ0_9AGAM|nr:hypothetical protein EWM64_g6853 [Hericium alpestre]